MSVSERIVQGAMAGCAATVPMTAAMEALRAVLPREQWRRMPPREVVDRTIDRVGLANDVDRTERTIATTVAHFAFGTAAGAIYGALAGRRRSSVAAGIAYGLAVWAVSYGVVLPSLGLHRAAASDTPDRNEVLAVSHVVWGASLARLSR